MQYMIVIIVACIVVVAVVALIFVCCCCRRRNNKLKNKTADMEVSHRGVVTQQVRLLCSGFLTLYIPYNFTVTNAIYFYYTNILNTELLWAQWRSSWFSVLPQQSFLFFQLPQTLT